LQRRLTRSRIFARIITHSVLLRSSGLSRGGTPSPGIEVQRVSRLTVVNSIFIDICPRRRTSCLLLGQNLDLRTSDISARPGSSSPEEVSLLHPGIALNDLGRLADSSQECATHAVFIHEAHLTGNGIDAQPALLHKRSSRLHTQRFDSLCRRPSGLRPKCTTKLSRTKICRFCQLIDC
jgi:hypothetical protein